MVIIGLTGSIASGKSTVSNMLKSLGAPIIDADVVAREIVHPHAEGLRAIVAAFGEEYLLADGQLDRAKLGDFIFRDPKKRELLNKIMHPIIRKKMFEEAVRYEEMGAKAVIMDVPLLLELGWQKDMTEVWLVYVEEAVQKERLMLRNGLTAEEADIRIASQMSLNEKRAFADHTIDNGGSLEETKRQAEKLWQELTARLG